MARISVGTVDRVIHNRSGVSKKSRKRVEDILKKLDYQPNIYASALASNKKYAFACLLPQHLDGEYWTAVEAGINEAVKTYSDFNASVSFSFYDPYDYHSFLEMGDKLLNDGPVGIILAPTTPEYSKPFINRLIEKAIPYIYIDSLLKELPPLAFFGQNPGQSGYFAARIMMMMARENKEIAIFRMIHQGIVGSNQQENRELGFRQYMKEHHPDCKIWELDLHSNQPDTNNRTLDNFFKQHPLLSDCITFNSKVYIMGKYLRTHKMDNFHLIGYDLLKQNVDCLKDGSVSFLIAQQPELQGYNAIKALCDHLIFKKEINRINYMPIDLLTKETIDYYHNK